MGRGREGGKGLARTWTFDVQRFTVGGDGWAWFGLGGRDDERGNVEKKKGLRKPQAQRLNNKRND